MMKPYGAGSLSFEAGYDLSMILSHLEGLESHEADTLPQRLSHKRWKRQALVEEAIDKLNEAVDMGDE